MTKISNTALKQSLSKSRESETETTSVKIMNYTLKFYSYLDEKIAMPMSISRVRSIKESNSFGAQIG